MYMYVCTVHGIHVYYSARKHTGKVGPRAVKKSPVRESNGHISPSPTTTEDSSTCSSLTDNEDTNAAQRQVF